MYSIAWEKVVVPKTPQCIEVRVTMLTPEGEIRTVQKVYEEWIGVCTNRIDSVVKTLQFHFPGSQVRYERMGSAKKVLPYFRQRVATGKLSYRSKPFYKLFTNAPHKSVGQFFHSAKMGYFEPEDWLARLYLDLCTRHDTHAFYYRWYSVREEAPLLLDALQMHPERNDPPDWTVAAFDLEAVPMTGNHVPVGHSPHDRVVMASVFSWNRRRGVRRHLLYLLPDCLTEPLPGYPDGFRSESEMLDRLHDLLAEAQVITGYNVDAFDLPLLFARLFWLNKRDLLRRYRSRAVGGDTVVTLDGRLVIDLYAYFKTFSAYDLPSFKLDDVARVKLEGEAKLPVQSTGIWCWYRSSHLSPELFEEGVGAEDCFRVLRPPEVRSAAEFGTFRTYLDYCLRDSELVQRLFEKEHALSLLVERANFTTLDAVEALHLGNSRVLLELFKTYAFRLGYFVSWRHLQPKTSMLGGQTTYQGALNYCVPARLYEDVSVMDFTSMYPSALLSGNLCYGTTDILSREEWLATAPQLTALPYRLHSDRDFEEEEEGEEEPAGARFRYPPVQESDEYVIVVHSEAEAFLPEMVRHFLAMRQRHQSEWRRTGDPYHYNVQLGIKILVNSLYGVMANRDSPLAYLPIAAAIVTLSRYQLLASYHYLRRAGYDVCYADTDSLMVCRWPHDHCDPVNEYLALPGVELKFEQRMKRLLVLSKKRYVYETAAGRIVTKGFQKKINGLVEYMTDTLLTQIWADLGRAEGGADPGTGWELWVRTLLEAHYRCRDPRRYALYRKIRPLEEYKSKSCPAVKYLLKYPERRGDEHVEFTYSEVDLAASEASKWVVDVDDCPRVNFEQLFMSQKKIFCTLLNMTYWRLPATPTLLCDRVLNGLRWKRFMHAELLHKHATGRGFTLLLVPGLRYTFTINDHLTTERRRGRRKRAREEE